MHTPWFVHELSEKLDKVLRNQELLDKQQNMLLQQNVDIQREIKELYDALIGTVDRAIIVIKTIPQGAKVMASVGLVLPLDETSELLVLAFDKNGNPTTPKNPPTLSQSDSSVISLSPDADDVGVDVSAVSGQKPGAAATISAVVDGVTASGWQLGTAAGAPSGTGPLPVTLAAGSVASAVIVAGAPK